MDNGYSRSVWADPAFLSWAASAMSSPQGAVAAAALLAVVLISAFSGASPGSLLALPGCGLGLRSERDSMAARKEAGSGLLRKLSSLVSGSPKASWLCLPSQGSGPGWLAEAMALVFWASYPEPARFGFPGVLSWFLRHRPSPWLFAWMEAALAEERRSEAWVSGGGRWIPSANHWLGRSGWLGRPDAMPGLIPPDASFEGDAEEAARLFKGVFGRRNSQD